ncbi:MAG TPA: YdcF family protein [Terracidiphilus sp.]|jgi:uncharacterized SAM-binding protein YcdF (DUF218 family)|nr:YdcF family protein [Terracidiphilus sp.]
MSTSIVFLLASVALVCVVLAWAMLARIFAPTGNTSATRFDAIIVLGAGVDREGNPTPALLARVTEGVREYERGVAPRLILTGGPSHGFVQADVMARIAQAQGVPASAILTEPQAGNTIQNACFSTRILKAHGGQSAEFVTSAVHLPRAGLIFSRMPIAWRAHPAPALDQSSAGFSAASEVLHTAYYLIYSQWAGRCSP